MESYFTDSQPTAKETAPSSPIFTPGAKVLLIQDVVPWASAPNQSPLGANVTQLECMDEKFDLVPSRLIGVIALNQYREIIISAAQTQRFYDNLFPGGFIAYPLVDWAQGGGILSANLTDYASGPGGGGNWGSRVFLTGVQHVFDTSNDNGIADPRDPIITGTFGACSGGPIKDVGPLADLDGWGASSHGYFTDLPTGTRVILAVREGGQLNLKKPVMVEFPFGFGRVIASLVTNEWRYVGGFGSLPQNRKLLANEFGYQRHLACSEAEAERPQADEPAATV